MTRFDDAPIASARMMHFVFIWSVGYFVFSQPALKSGVHIV